MRFLKPIVKFQARGVMANVSKKSIDGGTINISSKREWSSFLSFGNKLCIFLLTSLLVSGCAGIKTRDQINERVSGKKATQKEPGKKEGAVLIDETPPEEAKGFDQDGMGGVVIAPEPGTRKAYSPETLPKVGVILGPGGFKSFAHAGVLKEFEKAQIPVDAIVGLEWGSLIAALYAEKGLVHEVEWRLFKLESKDVPAKGFLSAVYKTQTIESMRDYFSAYIKGQSIAQMKVPFACPSVSIGSGYLAWQDSGSLERALEKCLPYPPIFKAKDSWMAASFAVKESIDYLKQKGIELIVLVNVLGEGELLSGDNLVENAPTAVLWQELRRSFQLQQGFASEVIQVNTRALNVQDFDARKQLVLAGEQAGKEAADRIALKYGF